MRITNKNTVSTLLAAGVVGVALLTASGLVVWSAADATNALEAETAALTMHNVSAGVAHDLLQAELGRITDFSDELEALRRSLPASTKLAPFILQLDALALEHRVSVDAVTVSGPQVRPTRQAAAAAAAGTPVPTIVTPVDAGTLLGIPVSLNVSGTADDVLALLNGLQRGERMLSVTSFNTTQVTETNTVTGTISVVVYVLTAPAGN